MRLKTIICAATLAAACGVGTNGAVHAADMPAIFGTSASADEVAEPVEFGTGWYLRGDAAFSDEDRPKLTVSGTMPTFDAKATDIGYGFGGGAGYKFNSFLRADLTADYLDPFKDKATIACGPSCDIGLQTRVWRWDGLANGYLDLGTWAGITPYVGAGVGAAGTHRDGTVTINGSVTHDPSHTDYQLAWAAMAGFSYAFAPHLLLDVGYRYLDLGKTTIPLSTVPSVTKNMTSQQIRVGVRYMID